VLWQNAELAVNEKSTAPVRRLKKSQDLLIERKRDALRKCTSGDFVGEEVRRLLIINKSGVVFISFPERGANLKNLTTAFLYLWQKLSN